MKTNKLEKIVSSLKIFVIFRRCVHNNPLPPVLSCIHLSRTLITRTQE